MVLPLRRAVFAAALLLPLSLVAQGTSNGGPYAPLVLLLPSGARTLALGNTGVGGRDDDVVFFNPAQLVIARAGFGGSIERYSATSAGGALSAVTRFNNGGVGIGMRMVDLEMRTWYGGPTYFLLGAVHAVAYWLTVSFLTPFILLVALFNGRKRLLHDMLVGTIVINNPARASALRNGRRPY